VTVNNVAATSSSNTLTDVVPGVTLTLNAEDANKTVRVSVSRDAEGLRKQVDGFVKSYNDLVGWVNDQRTAATEGKTSVAREAVVRGLHSDLRAAILGEHGDGSLKRLAAVGIGFDRSGLMTVDSKAFGDAVNADPGAVQELFAGASDGSTDGAFDDLAELVSSYADAGGLVARAKDGSTTRSRTSPAGWTCWTPSSRCGATHCRPSSCCRSSDVAPEQPGQSP
jgi:flagellar hook-associated protein 2